MADKEQDKDQRFLGLPYCVLLTTYMVYGVYGIRFSVFRFRSTHTMFLFILIYTLYAIYCWCGEWIWIYPNKTAVSYFSGFDRYWVYSATKDFLFTNTCRLQFIHTQTIDISEVVVVAIVVIANSKGSQLKTKCVCFCAAQREANLNVYLNLCTIYKLRTNWNLRNLSFWHHFCLTFILYSMHKVRGLHYDVQPRK